MPRARVLNDESLLDHLLRRGLEIDDRDSWKHLALLMNVCHGVPKAKQAVIKLIRSKFTGQIGHLLDNIRDFQQANYLVELLSNCFPRKSTNEVGVVMPPAIWPEDAKNDLFFNSTLYPFRGRHGDAQVIDFLLAVLSPRLKDVMIVGNLSYHSTGMDGDHKISRAVKGGKLRKHFYVQASHDGIYLWDGDGMFLEINRRHIEISKIESSKVKITIIGKPSKCFRSTNKTWLQQFLHVEWLLLEADSQESHSQFLGRIDSVRKISEVQTYLVLNHSEEEPIDRADCTVREDAQATRYASDHEPASPRTEHNSRPEKKDQLATPDQSDARICSDEWDFKPSSDQQAAQTAGGHDTRQHTPKAGSEMDPKDLPDDDGSPLVLAQKRKKIRETTKTLEMLKKGFSLASNPPSSKDDDCRVLQRSPSLLITKFETKTSAAPKNSKAADQLATPEGNTVKSIAPRDINILDTIFGKPESSARKKPKRQQRLKNYKPVIEVPSQDLPPPRTRNQKKKGPVVTKKDVPVITPRSRVPEKRASEVIDQAAAPEPPTVKAPSAVAPKSRNPEKRIAKVTAKDASPEPPTGKTTSVVTPKRLPEGTCIESKSTKKHKSRDTRAAKVQDKDNLANVEKIDNPTIDSTDLMDSTTILGNVSCATPMPVLTGNVLTDKLQEQIISSISHFSNEMVRKMTIINNELNNTIVKELSGKYQKLFQELQQSFHDDTEEMLKFVAEIKDMMRLPEEELITLIRTRNSRTAHLKSLPSNR